MMIEDIKPLVAIDDYSFYLFIFVMLLGVAVFFALVFFLWQFKGKNHLKEVLKELESLHYDNPKADAYKVTALARELLVDEQLQQKFDHLNEKLSHYKYKKQVSSFDSDVKKEIALFVELASARI